MFAAVVSAAFLIPAVHAFEILVPYTVDTKLGEASIVSGDATELAKMEYFVSQLLGSATTLVQDLKDDAPTAVANPGTTGEWYIDVAPATPGYFLLKFGAGNTGLPDHYFFQNIGELDKLVFSNAQVNFLTGGGDINGNIGKLSHYVTYDGVNPPCTDCVLVTVPEPTTLLLMSAGLFGFGLARRRKSA